MPTDLKISQLTNGNPAQTGDLLPIDRSGANFSLTAGSVAALTTDATIVTSDVTTNNVSTSKHGWAPKAPNDATKFLDGTGNYSTPASGAAGLPDPFTQFSLWFPNDQTGDNQYFTPSSVWGTRVVVGSQSSPTFYTPLDAIGVWTTPVAILRSQAAPDAFMGYSGNIIVNNASTSKIQSSGNAWIWPGRKGKFKAAEMAATGVANFRHWIGIFDAFADISILEPSSAAASVAGAMFFFNHNDSANWQCFTSDRSGSFNLVNSGVAFATNTVYKLEIDWDGAGVYTFFINGTQVAQISTFTPTGGLGSGMCMMHALGSNGNGTGHGTRTAVLYGENSY